MEESRTPTQEECERISTAYKLLRKTENGWTSPKYALEEYAVGEWNECDGHGFYSYLNREDAVSLGQTMYWIFEGEDSISRSRWLDQYSEIPQSGEVVYGVAVIEVQGIQEIGKKFTSKEFDKPEENNCIRTDRHRIVEVEILEKEVIR